MKTSTSLIKKFGYIALICILFNIYDASSQIRITQVDPFSNQITIHNFGTTMEPLGGYWFCTRISYAQFSPDNVVSGSLNLAAGADVTIVVNTTAGLNNGASDLSIYINGSDFSNAASMVDFMQYGDDFPAGFGREDEAVSQGLWTAGDFILGDPAPWAYTGSDGTQNGVTFWTSATLSINDEQFASEVSLYPNPVIESLNVRELQQVDLKNASIFDMTGRMVGLTDLNNNLMEKIIDLRNIQSGLYVLKLTDIQGRVLTKKFVKE